MPAKCTNVRSQNPYPAQKVSLFSGLLGQGRGQTPFLRRVVKKLLTAKFAEKAAENAERGP